MAQNRCMNYYYSRQSMCCCYNAPEQASSSPVRYIGAGRSHPLIFATVLTTHNYPEVPKLCHRWSINSSHTHLLFFVTDQTPETPEQVHLEYAGLIPDAFEGWWKNILPHCTIRTHEMAATTHLPLLQARVQPTSVSGHPHWRNPSTRDERCSTL